MEQYQRDELNVLQRYVDFYRSLPEIRSLTGFGFDLVKDPSPLDRTAYRRLEAKGLLTIERKTTQEEFPVIEAEYAQLSTKGAGEVVRLFKEGTLTKNDI